MTLTQPDILQCEQNNGSRYRKTKMKSEGRGGRDGEAEGGEDGTTLEELKLLNHGENELKTFCCRMMKMFQ